MTIDPAPVSLLAQRYGIPPTILFAIIQVESGWRADLARFEPGYRWLWDARHGKPYTVPESFVNSVRAPDDFKGILPESDDSEWILQRISFGPAQVLGSTSRWLGYREPLLNLASWTDGVEYGCKYLDYLRNRHVQGHGWAGVVAAYNAGSPRYVDDETFVNQEYVHKVLEAGAIF